jgi:uncharacterized protein YwqG
MTISNELVKELSAYASSKRGASQHPAQAQEEPEVRLGFAGEWNTFFKLSIDRDYDEETSEWIEKDRYLHMPALSETLERHQLQYPAIRKSSWMERDGHIYLEVPVAIDVPVNFLKSLIDDAHAIVWKKLKPKELRLVELSEMPYDERALLDGLVTLHGLSEHRGEIHELTRPAIVLQTSAYDEHELPLGASKMGGRPDLPAEALWPTYRNGKPLAFLTQINLNEISRLPPPFRGLPKDGLISVFSVWGWVDGDNLDPDTPADHSWKRQEDSGWTVVLHTPSNDVLERREIPDGVNSFKAALIEPKTMLSLPNATPEPALVSRGWPLEVADSFDSMQSDYRMLQTRQWRKQGCAMESAHMLGGYAIFQQMYPEELLQKDLVMFLQISSDTSAGMWWSDAGELTFYASPKGLAAGRFERIWGTCQGG